MMKRITALLLLACLVLSGLSNAKTAYADDSWYTYTYNYWGDEEASPDAYTVDRVISGSAFGEDVGSLLNPDSLFSIDDLLYVVDSKNNRIIEAQWKNGEFRTVRVIYHVNVSEEKKDLLKIGDKIELCLLQPGDVFVYPARYGQKYGHAVMVVDVGINRQGKKVFLLAEGNTPARNIHIMRNFENPFRSPWFTLDEDADNLLFSVFHYKSNDLKTF